MRREIRMPRKSEYSDSGTIARWRVSVGDFVARGDAIADVNVDMSTEELRAEADGKIVEIWVHAGQSVPVETVIAMQSVADDSVAEKKGDAEETAAELSGSDAEVDTDSATDEEEFPEMDESAANRPDSDEAARAAGKSDEAVVRYGHVLASPAAVQLAEQYNVNLETLTGTGSCGRIEREDVEAALQTTSQFITVEDVDDLMNFDGDFSSDFSTEEGKAKEAPALADDSPVQDEDDPAGEEMEMAEAQSAEDSAEGDGEETREQDAGPSAVPAEEEDDPVGDEVMDADAAGAIEEQEAALSDDIAEAGAEVTADETAEDSGAPFGAGEEVVADIEDEADGVQEESVDDRLETAPAEQSEGGEETDESSEEEVTADPDAAEMTAVTPEEMADAQPAGDSAVGVAGGASAYEPTAAERAAVAGFSAAADAESETEALAIDESDTIDPEEDLAIGSAEADELPGDSGPVRLDAATAASAIAQVGGDEFRKSVKVRRLVARKMEQSWQQAPHFFVTVAVDMTDIIRFRSDLGVTINDFILAATTRALQEHPWVNSHFIDDEAVEQPEINISLAVETEKGLYYPVIRNCGGRSVKDIGIAAAEMVVKAHSGKLAERDMEGGSFTISNMGMLGVESFSAIITPPQVAVLAVGTVKGEVVIDEHEEMVMAPMVRLTLSADHRALDGADAADFLGTMKSYLEAPITLVAAQDD